MLGQNADPVSAGTQWTPTLLNVYIRPSRSLRRANVASATCGAEILRAGLHLPWHSWNGFFPSLGFNMGNYTPATQGQ